MSVDYSLEELKRKLSDINSGKVSIDTLPLVIDDCIDFINHMIFEAIIDYTNPYQSYCSFAYAMGAEYDISGNSPMWVSLTNDGKSFNINPIQTLDIVRSIDELYFIIAHEVSHLLFGHFEKYYSKFNDTVNRVFINLATDVEVNESVCSRINRGIGCDMPKYAINYNVVAKILGMDKDYVRRCYNGYSFSSRSVSTADHVYSLFNKKCEKVLGYTINSILYRILVYNNTTFEREIKNTAKTGKSVIFDIKPEQQEEAIRFCTELSKYLDDTRITKMVVVNSDNPSKENTKQNDGYKDYKESRGNNMYDKKPHREDRCSEGEDDKGITEGIGDTDGNGTDVVEDIKDGTNDRDEYDDVYSNCCVGLDVGDIDTVVSEIKDISDVYISNLSQNIKSRSIGNEVFKKDVDLDLRKSQISWQDVLSRKLKTMSMEKEHTKKRVNRRQPDRLELSGKKCKKVVTLVVGIDESGSITDMEYNYFISELNSIIRSYNIDLHLYEFTSVVTSYTKVTSRSGKQRLDMRIFKSRFSGGTSFQCVYDAVNENRDITNRDCLVVMFTDGIGEDVVDYHRIENRMWVVPVRDIEKEASVSCESGTLTIFPIVVK